MRKIVLLLCLFTVFVSKAQDSLHVGTTHFEAFIGFGLAVVNNIEMNKYLEQQGIAQIEPLEGELTTGLEYFDSHIDIDWGVQYQIGFGRTYEDESRYHTHVWGARSGHSIL
jgi:hypothetical protein